MQLKEEEIVIVDGQEWLRQPVVARDLSVQTDAMARATASDEESVLFWQDMANPDLVWVKFILDCEGPNLNWDYMPRPVLAKCYGTAKYKPMDMEHIVKEKDSYLNATENLQKSANTIFGVMTHSALASASGALLSADDVSKMEMDDVLTRPQDQKLCCVGWAALYNFIFPETVKDIVAYAGDGNMYVSMERWIKEWDFLVRDGDTYKSVSRAQAKEIGVDEMWKKRQQYNDAPILRRSLDFIYGGVASTKTPANPASVFLTSEVAKATASSAQATILRQLHDSIHDRFDTAGESEKAHLIKCHEYVTRALAALH